MKKRSLFAAVAMLIVSAIVLTSATFAWFVSGSNASISNTSVNVQAAGTGVQLKTLVTGAVWKDSLEKSEFTNSTTDMFVTYDAEAHTGGYAPVSSATGAADFVKTAIGTGSTFTTGLSATAGTDYDTYQFMVGTVAAGDTVVGTLTIGGDAAAAARVAVQTKKVTDTNWGTPTIYSNATETNVYAITSVPANAVDKNGNYILDTDDGSYSSNLAAQTTTATGTGGYGVLDKVVVGQAGSGNETMVKVTVWIEGNDPDCTALNIAEKNVTTTWGFIAAAPTTVQGA